QFDKSLVEGFVGGVLEAEIIHVEGEGAVGLLPDELPHFVHIARLAIRRHPHDLVFALVDLETQERGKRAVEQSYGMGKKHLLAYFDLAAPPYSPSAGYPFTDTVDGENRRFVKG